MTVTWRLGTTHIDIATVSGTVIARHDLAPDGAGVMVREHAHVTALEARVLASHDDSAPHRRKERIPPGHAARTAADALRERHRPDDTSTTSARPATTADVVTDLSAYDRAAKGRNTLP